MAQLGARFHGMEEVDGSNPSRSTKIPQTVTVLRPAKNVATGVQLESKPPISRMGSLGHRVDFDAAHTRAYTVNMIEGMGSVGTVFHACCLLETTKTFVFPIRTMPHPTGHRKSMRLLTILKILKIPTLRPNDPVFSVDE